MIKVGIFFGGPSREREISFAGGRTVHDNLNKSLFEPVLIFVDSLKNLILLDWKYAYKGTIRDFYPPVEFLRTSPNNFQVYIESLDNLDALTRNDIIQKVGKEIKSHELPRLIDFAFLALHGAYGEDGVIQGILESLEIPYSGSGILPSSIGMDKAFQKEVLSKSGFPTPNFVSIKREEWLGGNQEDFFHRAIKTVGEKYVIRPANQGSSIGVSILMNEELTAFQQAVDKGFFVKKISKEEWNERSAAQQVKLVKTLTDIREGIGIPVTVGKTIIYHPEDLLSYIDNHFESADNELLIEGVDAENQVIIESFIEGKEFSCIVIKNVDGQPLALPPTEIVKGREVFDYRSKYMAGLSRKITPINIEEAKIEAIRKDCEVLFQFFKFDVYARIDGFIQEDGTIYLNDPNTTSGMLPSSFFFHQAAEIGLNPSQFLTYIIRTSLEERLKSGHYGAATNELLNRLDSELILMKSATSHKRRIAVILGGISTERHISVESGRNIYEKLASSEKYEPIPVFLTGSLAEHELYQIPVNILLKDNADDIREKINTYKQHPVIERIKKLGKNITGKYAYETVSFEPGKLSYEQLAKKVDGVFIALHGRPGEDGAVQEQLEKYNVPYNGSGIDSSKVTINKFRTNQTLKEHGFKVADQTLVYHDEYEKDAKATVERIIEGYEFPLIAKPVDEGCSSAVKKINSKASLEAYFQLAFRKQEAFDPEAASTLHLKPKEEFPVINCILIENFIEKGNAKYFLEVTGGMLTHLSANDEITFEVFEPSEVLAGGEVLSLEEKFLAGEGQNLTPARFGINKKEYNIIAGKVKKDLEKAARILNIEGYCRIDAFVRVSDDMQVETIIIEVNSLPGMTPATCIFHQAAISGYKPYEFIDEILEFSFKKRSVEFH